MPGPAPFWPRLWDSSGPTHLMFYALPWVTVRSWTELPELRGEKRDPFLGVLQWDAHTRNDPAARGPDPQSWGGVGTSHALGLTGCSSNSVWGPPRTR